MFSKIKIDIYNLIIEHPQKSISQISYNRALRTLNKVELPIHFIRVQHALSFHHEAEPIEYNS